MLHSQKIKFGLKPKKIILIYISSSRLPFHYPDVHKISRVRREAGHDGIATYQRYRYYNKLADPTIDTLVSYLFLIKC